MRILQINSVCGIGSTGRIATDIHGILQKEKHESSVAFGRGDPMNCDNAYRIGNKYDTYAHLAGTRIFDKHGFYSKNATKKLIQYIKKLAPDVIHLHNIHGYYLNIEILFSFLKEHKKPIVWTLHDCWSFTGHCAHFDSANCYNWKSACKNCIQKKEYPTSLLFDNSKKNFDMKKRLFTAISEQDLIIVTPSDWLAALVGESFLKKYKIKVINNGIDTTIFKPTQSNFREKYNLQNKFIVLGVASAWGKKKGFDDFIKLSGMLDDSFQIVMVGLNKKQLSEIPTNIIGIERTDSVTELAEIYSTADIFFNPTYEDVYPTTNLEAISCGTPTVVYNTGGAVEMINDDNGIIIEKGNLQAFYDFLNTKPMRDFNIKQYNRFDKNKLLVEYLNLYEMLLIKETV